ncbi:DUF2793 domain-containing protein [Jannaschia sp. S6380]|uniref:DUF2793 domain-containing protein n=1 Tax=Jannaschia sp. S6380 TaxID=2926408 RepID=UPI001FF6AB2F|nr:DUF2793 domain-containing protein [Jannaschia sp. S6380]MCK0168688.1 DUF2793 domain-containing protein [Jannaschia sp. S6380]
MSENTTILSLPLIQGGQAQKHITHNEALRMLDALVQPVVTDADRTAPPDLPAEGDRHIVAPGAIGAWSGRDGDIAVFAGNGWTFLSPAPGWRVHDAEARVDRRHDGTAWIADAAPAPETLPQLGINAAADAANRLAVASDSTLLTHDGSDHRLVLNKAGSGDTGTLLFQTGYSGRAEMGCAGEDAFSVKVSADGTGWTTALRFDALTGLATGAAVQDGPGDVTPGRLARTDGTFGPGNLLAPVATVAGLPAGGVIERRETATGIAVLHADGTMICHGTVTLTQSGGHKMVGDWDYPAAFAETTPVISFASVDHSSVWSTSSVQPKYLGVLTHQTVSGDTLRLHQYKGDNPHTFSEMDELVVNVVAIGSWR